MLREWFSVLLCNVGARGVKISYIALHEHVKSPTVTYCSYRCSAKTANHSFILRFKLQLV